MHETLERTVEVPSFHALHVVCLPGWLFLHSFSFSLSTISICVQKNRNYIIIKKFFNIVNYINIYLEISVV